MTTNNNNKNFKKVDFSIESKKTKSYDIKLMTGKSEKSEKKKDEKEQKK